MGQCNYPSVSLRLLVCAALAVTVSLPAAAGKILEIDGNKWISVGAGVRMGLTSVEDAAPSGEDNSSDLNEFELNYVIDGHNAGVNFNYGTGDANISGYPGADVDLFSIGVQLQL